jgi:hypothetical protein
MTVEQHVRYRMYTSLLMQVRDPPQDIFAAEPVGLCKPYQTGTSKRTSLHCSTVSKQMCGLKQPCMPVRYNDMMHDVDVISDDGRPHAPSCCLW